MHYVDLTSTNATPPYTNWTTAATNIQDAVDAAAAGDEVVVTNGTYVTGGRAVYGTMTNRVAVDKPLMLRSVNGPQSTVIQGYHAPDGNGDGAIRCVYLTNGANLSGFTLTSGATRYVYPDGPPYPESSGGGAWCESTNSVTVSNCVLTDNTASFGGGGAYGGTLNNCTLTGNWISPPGYYSSDWSSYSVYAYGGGAYNCTLNNCTLTANSASATSITQGAFNWSAAYGYALGGGAYGCTLRNCSLNNNTASATSEASHDNYPYIPLNAFAYALGGGAYACALINCALGGNSATAFVEGGTVVVPSEAEAEGGGAYGSILGNCILTTNFVAASGVTWDTVLYAAGGGVSGRTHNCIIFNNSPDQGGTSPGRLVGDSWLGDPLFVDYAGGNLRLQSNSPCINAGNNSYLTNSYFTNCFDLDGNPRVVGGTVDIGAYEFQTPASMISYAWLQQFNLPISNSTDTADPDGDGVDNYHEWLAGTDPTNPLSSSAQLTIIPSGVPPSAIILTWSTNAVGFTLQATTNLLSPAAWVTNSLTPVVIAGQNTVTNPITVAQRFYRLIQ